MDTLVPFGNHAGEALLGLSLVMFLLALALAILVVVFGIMMVVQAFRAGRQGWWVYLIVLFIGPLNIIAIFLWFFYFKRNPVMVGGKPFL